MKFSLQSDFGQSVSIPPFHNLSQFFTPDGIVRRMMGLRRNHGRVLEPSCGDGAFMSKLGKEDVGIEIDSSLLQNDKRIIHSDFFNYPISEKFNTIISNPPYVRFQDILPSTKKLLQKGFDKRSNLYLFFIDKCINHLNDFGELIFITPRSFLKATSAKNLNQRLYEEGSITHFYDLGDATIFKGASPNCAIWRWEKGRKSRETETGGDFCFSDGQLWFGAIGNMRLGNLFEVKVGAVSGADDIFINENGNVDMVCSTTLKDGKTRRVIYNQKDESLLKHKKRLMNRKVRKFDETNWWMWGRGYCERKGMRIYVNSKTRISKPFYASNVVAYDGSVLALFPKKEMDIQKAVEKLNNADWAKLGFVCDGRYMFTQRSLGNVSVMEE